MNYGVEICLRELLFEQECVIIPNFGGFLTQYKSAEINHLAKVIYPPTKTVSFNRQLKNDDGLLINAYSSLNNVSYAEAALAVKKWVLNFERGLKETGEAKITKIGAFYWDKVNSSLSFDFESGQNYLAETYGLPEVKAIPIARSKTTEKSEAILAEPFLKESKKQHFDKPGDQAKSENEKEINNTATTKRDYSKAVAFLAGIAFALTITLPALNIHAPKLSLNEANVLSVFNKLFNVNDEITVEPIAFNENAIPPVSTDIKLASPVFVDSQKSALKQTETQQTILHHSSTYQIVLGAFREEANAENYVSKINSEHASFGAATYKKGSLNYVVIPAGNTEMEARQLLREAKASYECWLKKI